MEDGAAIETGMIGKDGAFGASQASDDKLSLHKVVVQVPGMATVIDAYRLKDVTQSSPELLALLIKYEQFFLGQVQQTTACNASHNVEQRMCKWLIRMYDLVGSELPLTRILGADDGREAHERHGRCGPIAERRTDLLPARQDQHLEHGPG